MSPATAQTSSPQPPRQGLHHHPGGVFGHRDRAHPRDMRIKLNPTIRQLGHQQIRKTPRTPTRIATGVDRDPVLTPLRPRLGDAHRSAPRAQLGQRGSSGTSRRTVRRSNRCPHRARYTSAGCSPPGSTAWARPSTRLQPHSSGTGPDSTTEGSPDRPRPAGLARRAAGSTNARGLTTPSPQPRSPHTSPATHY
jgi:hypothetical protein